MRNLSEPAAGTVVGLNEAPGEGPRLQDILVEGPDSRQPVADRRVGWLATTVTLYDALGRSVRTLYDGIAAPQQLHTLSIDGTDDYLNCPFTKQEYDAFYDALLSAQSVEGHDWEFILTELGWRWTFLLGVPFTLLAMVLGNSLPKLPCTGDQASRTPATGGRPPSRSAPCRTFSPATLPHCPRCSRSSWSSPS